MARTPRSHSPVHVFFFSFLAPVCRGGCSCLDTFSTMRYSFSNSLQGWFRVTVYSLSSLYLAGWPGGPAVSFANKLWGNLLQIWSQTPRKKIDFVRIWRKWRSNILNWISQNLKFSVDLSAWHMVGPDLLPNALSTSEAAIMNELIWSM